MTLLTKIQKKDYEAGEFSDLKQRTFPETIDLIQNFPWIQEREHIAVGLTNPSITIEGSSGDYLKLAPYFSGKFVLYYVDIKNHLFTHAMATISEADPIIQSFFEDRLNPTDLKREPTPFVDNRAQFQTKTFIYTSHYRASKRKLLSISRGNPLFQFGNINNPATYNKEDIREIIQYSAYRGLEGLERTQIIFTDNREINISGMIASTATMSNKFPQLTIKQKTRAYPIVPADA